MVVLRRRISVATERQIMRQAVVGWQGLLKQGGFDGGDIEVHEEQGIFRGRILKVVCVGERLLVQLAWRAELVGGSWQLISNWHYVLRAPSIEPPQGIHGPYCFSDSEPLRETYLHPRSSEHLLDVAEVEGLVLLAERGAMN